MAEESGALVGRGVLWFPAEAKGGSRVLPAGNTRGVPCGPSPFVNLISGSPFWPINDGLGGVYPPLTENVDCEVAIIGGGITGALVGFHLAEAGIATVVLDRRDAGHGSTAGSTALLQYEVDTPLHRLKKQVGEAAAVRSYLLCRDAVAKLRRLAARLGGCGCAARESLYVASQANHVPALEREFVARRAAGLAVEFWDRKRIAAETSLPQRAAILSYEAAEIDAYRFTHALLQAANRKGQRVYDRTTATAIRRRRGRVRLETDRGACVDARRVVLASGYEAQNDFHTRFTALHSTYALVSEPLGRFPGWPKSRLLWETARPYFYLRTIADGRVLIGGADVPFRNPTARDALLGAKTRYLAGRFGRLFPDAPMEVAYAWTGTFAETRDGLPFVGVAPEKPYLYVALGYGGNGITYSLVAAEIIRDLYLGRDNPDAAIFGFDRGR